MFSSCLSVASQPFLCQVYLWHGTQVRTGLQIAMNDFNLTFAGSGAGAWVRFRYRGSILSSFMILYDPLCTLMYIVYRLHMIACCIIYLPTVAL
jgi:hypothetical protein